MLTGTQGVMISDTNQLKEMICSNSSTQLQNNLVVKLNVSSYELYQIDGYCIVQNINNLTIQGVNGNSTIRCVPVGSPGSGFGFINITNLLLANLHFDGCGGVIPSTAVRSFNNTHPQLLYKQRAVLMFNLCNNVTIRQVNIDNKYFGYAILILNPFGTFEVFNTTVFEGVGGCSDDTTSCSGSGIAAIFKNRGKSADNENNAQVTLKETKVEVNINIIPNIPTLSSLREYEACQLLVVGAAGLTVIFTQTDYIANFTTTQSTIGDINYGTVAGGMLILFLNGMEKSHVSITNTSFYGGGLLSDTHQVGGSYITIYSFNCGKCSSGTLHSHMLLPMYFDTVYISDIGEPFLQTLNHGAMFYIDIYESCANNFKKFFMKNLEIKIHYTTLYQAGIYAAMRHSKANHSIVLESYQLKQDASNTASLYSQVATMTFVNWKNVTICGESYFHESQNPILAVYNTNLFIQGRTTFTNNSGSSGAAISLYHSSYLFLIPPLHATFLNNKALLYGGAIYAVNDPLPGDNMCVIQLGVNTSNLHNLDITMTFINNKAGLAGNSIYAALIYNCTQYYSTDLDIRVLLNATFEPIPTDNGLQHISSVPVEICYCSKSNVSDDKIQLHCTGSGTKSQTIHTYPGKSITLSIVPVDAMGLIVYSPVSASITPYHYYGPQDVLTLKEGQDLVPISGNRCSKVTYNIHSKTNQPKHGYLQLAIPGNQLGLSALIYVYPCPIGFQLSNNGICECNHFITKVITNAECNISTLLITRPIGSWLGRINNSTLGFANICPSGNCRSTTIAINVSDIDHSICIDGKTGVLCGQCINTLSIIFGTTECRHCSNLWLLTLIGYTAIGVILVTVLLFLRLTLSDGPLASIILTNNIIAVSTIDYLDDDNVFISGMRIFVSLMNLNLGFPLCFYDGMTTPIKTGLQFIFPVYIWTIVIVFIVLSRYSIRISNQTAASSVQVLATLLHLSFSKLLITSIDILIYARVKTGNNDTITVWYGDGSVVYLQDNEHFILFSIAIVTLVLFILPYIIIVTFGNYFLRWKHLHHFRSFIESFHGPYKHTLGYWFGVRVIVVVYIYIVFTTLRGVDVTLMLFLQVIAVIPLALLQTHIKPFRKNGLNRMDSFCLFVIIVQIIVALLCVPARSHTSQTLSYITASLTTVIFGILVINISLKCLGKFKIKKCNTQFCDDSLKETHHSTEGHIQEDEEEYDEMRQALLKLAD